MPSSTRTPLVRDALEPWCAAGVTGALRVLDSPGGAVYLADGVIEYAESPVASSPERLLTASGRITPEAWRAAVASGKPNSRIGDELVAGGTVTRAEWEWAVILSTYDAAHFLFDLAAQVRFANADSHPLGRVRPLELHAVCTEVDRRKRLLADAWPDEVIDTAAVLPVRRLGADCVALSALQWEVVANADRRRSPIDLARLLGRDAFTVMLEVRRMVRLGLVEPGRPGGSVVAGAVATVRARAAASVPPPEPEPPVKQERPVGVPVDARAPLPRRRRPDEPPEPHPERSVYAESTLRRLIDGLEALR